MTTETAIPTAAQLAAAFGHGWQGRIADNTWYSSHVVEETVTLTRGYAIGHHQREEVSTFQRTPAGWLVGEIPMGVDRPSVQFWLDDALTRCR